MKRTNVKYSVAAIRALMAAPGIGRSIMRAWGQASPVRSRAKLIRIEWITAGGNHAWCESDCGLIRKPLASVPDELIAEFGGGLQIEPNR